MLKYKLDKESYNKLDESQQALYKEDGDSYMLQVEGATSKDKLDEFRTNNIQLQEDAKKFEGVDMDKYKAMLETDRKIRDKELIDRGEFDTLISERTAVMKSDFEARLEVATTNTANFETRYNNEIRKSAIEGAAHKAFSEHKIRPDAQNTIMAEIRGKFTVDNGQVIAKDGDSILIGKDGNLTVNEFVSELPDWSRVPNTEGKGNGNESSNNGMRVGTSSRDKIASGIRKLRAG